MQCKDIPDVPILKFLEGLNDTWATWFDYEPRPKNTVMHAMPCGVSQKLALAKMRMLIRKGVVDGCGCGCRGDFILTEKGRAAITATKVERDKGDPQ